MIGGFQLGAFQPFPAFQQVGGAQDAGRRRRTLDIYRIKIDGQVFEFKSLQDALAFLDKAKKAAAALAAQKAAEAAAKPGPVPLEVKVEVPKIEINSRDLRPAVAEVKRAYRQSSMETYLRLMEELDKRRRDDDDAITMLLM